MFLRVLLIATALSWVQSSFAEAAAKTTISFADMVQQSRRLRAEEAELIKEREARFKQNLAKQQKRLADANRERDAAEARSNALDAQHAANEKRIEELKTLLKQHEGNLGELFGVTRQIAGDAANVLQGSLITAQFPAKPGEEDRVAFMRRIAGVKALPSITELERLWFELQREMTESSKVIRFNAQVVQPDSSVAPMDVVRVGPFTVTSGDKFLAYTPQQAQLMVLSRQLTSDYRSIAEDLSTAPPEGHIAGVIDPARGPLLTMHTDRPDFLERIEQGEVVGYIIVAVGIAGALVAAFQYIYLGIMSVAMRQQLKDPQNPSWKNPLGRLFLAIKTSPTASTDSPEVVELRISEAILREVPKLERFQSPLRLAVAAGPLLGLIGTVIGMIITFQTITASGASDPKLMAHGIGQAMIATVLGLGIAIPLLFVNAGLASLSRGLVQILDEQSSALLAERIKSFKAA